MGFKNILFDLDGTLGHTLPFCLAAFHEALEPIAGRPLTDAEILATFGPSEEGTVMALVPERFNEGLAAYLASYDRLHTQSPTPFPGIPEILAALKARGHFLGLVTGKGPKSTAMTLRRYGMLNAFNAVETGSITGPVKERCIEYLILRHSMARGDVVYIGDAPSDVIAARACKIQAAAAAWAPTADLPALQAMRPDFLFTSVAGLADELGISVPNS
jgi:phosphoglycolate phosphatase/pyrophosphatase PpaX